MNTNLLIFQVDYFYDNFTSDDNLTDEIVMSLEIPDDLIDSCDVINDGENCKNIDLESEKTFKISVLHLVSFIIVYFKFSKALFYKFKRT